MKMWPFRHFGLKIGSVVIAVLLWLVVAGEETVERGLRVPLELQQFPAGLELQSEAPAFIDVRVRGSSGTLSRVGAGDIVGVLDLRSVRAGRRLFQLTPDQVRVPFGVQVVQVTPSNITLTFESSATREVSVSPSIEGQPAEGFVIDEMISNPRSVVIVGPETAVSHAAEAITEPISVDGARADVSGTVKIGLLDSALRLISPQMARVQVKIVARPEERVLNALPVHLRGTAKGMVARAVPSSAEVVLRGQPGQLKNIDPDAVVLSVDLTGLGPGEYNLGVRADAPSEAGVARLNPATVRVRISSVK